ncbi:alpha-L RNA-binding motif-containing protein [Gloeophyllum trabeum ATCC 11539]|uniref:Alpha-L RNA-binding motif-containing protein n=1 Tax=Gloeophyllum trabeum (strain ATCC 11539 / FP-39264 / Madison 617) TaxID=670483 RepID=S7RGD0_GLOTA|nr:alpha-L RNA-binding motif-containing protein [Gloeophyllum trabeum ATCC 11539]EPQ51589.1 alpha-L RNA-binding motif-containing protein [Gloeophyllum trabeum ATCC 11539]
MRDANIYATRRALPRMSWHPRNLYNLWRRSLGKKVRETDFTNTTKTLFQQRWAAKQLVRAYHGDFINEKIFKRWYLPATLPDVRPRKRIAGDDSIDLTSWAGRTRTAKREKERLAEEEAKGLAPVGSLMFAEVERRIDVFIFRCCFAHSVYEARRLVIHGDVLLNGKKHQNANTRLAPGDMVSVNPKAIRFLQPLPETKSEESEATEASSETSTEKTGNEVTSEAKAESEASSKETAESQASASEEDLEDSENETEKAPSKPRRTEQLSILAELAKDPNLTPFNLPKYASPFLFVPAYIEVSFPTCSAVYVRHPTARPGYSEIPTPFDADGEVVRLAWEWYSRVRPRMRSKSQLARMPERRESKGPSLVL